MADGRMSHFHVEFRRGTDWIRPPVLPESCQAQSGSFEQRFRSDINGVTDTTRVSQCHAAGLERHPTDERSIFAVYSPRRRRSRRASCWIVGVSGDDGVIDVRCGGCGKSLRVTIADLRDKFTVNCVGCAGRFHPPACAVAGIDFPNAGQAANAHDRSGEVRQEQNGKVETKRTYAASRVLN
jgi:hypothetical protein